ncbi:MAG: hypothetical protein J6Y87_07245 [Muribaculaceae bacterium]|nr:hypothetical protein [Muribaculaceae bacterium]MBR5743832.1 hypothetical protein [Muribaculaceae bacterium]
MATKKADQPLTVEQRLKLLYELQTILSHVDEIKTTRGELPNEVKDLEDTIEGLNTRINNFNEEIETLKAKIEEENAKVETAKAKIVRYKTQLDSIRNNREYEILSKEVEYCELEIRYSEKRINEYSHLIETRHADIAATQERLDDCAHALEEKRFELDEIMSETRAEEEQLRDKAKAIEPKIEPRLLSAFKRIRSNMRNGLGIVAVQRNACGGCFNRIPPQKQLEIRLHKKIVVCEYCGRILIDPELAQMKTKK